MCSEGATFKLSDYRVSNYLIIGPSSSNLWPTMLKGNVARCSGAFKFSWMYVDQVIMDNERFNFSAVDQTFPIDVVIGPTVQRVAFFGQSSLQCSTLDEKSFYWKARQLLALIPHLSSPCSEIRQLQRSASVPGNSDSGDEEVPKEAISPAFDDGFWKHHVLRLFESFLKKQNKNTLKMQLESSLFKS